MTSTFTIDWYLTQAFGQYCGYTRSISFLKDSDYKQKDCLLRMEMSKCDTTDSTYQLYSVNGMMDKFKQAFGITNASKVTPLFIFTQSNGKKATSTDISSLSFTATPSATNSTCTLTNYPSSIRAILSVKDQTVDSIKLMIYIRNIA